jgi:hypothetical protein
VSELPAFLAVVVVVAVVGVSLGILVSPRLTRLAERDEKESGDDEPG